MGLLGSINMGLDLGDRLHYGPALQRAQLEQQQAAARLASNNANFAPGMSSAQLQQQQQLAGLGAVQLQYADPMAHEALRQQQNATGMSDVNLKYADPMARAGLGQANANVDLTNANVNSMNAALPFTKYKSLAPYLSALAQLQKAQVMGSANFRAWIQTPQGQQLMTKDPELAYANYISIQKAGGFVTGEQGGGLGAPMPGTDNPMPMGTLPVPQSAPPGLGQGGPAMAPQGLGGPMPNEQPGLGAPPMAQPGMLPQGTQQDLPQTPQQKAALQKIFTPEQQEKIDSVQQAAEDAYIKKNYPADVQKRIYAGNRFRVTADQAMQAFDNGVDKYFSPAGRIKLGSDIANLALTGKESPELENYRKFEQAIEQANVQGAFLEGVPADQISRGSYKKIFDLSTIANSPEGARKQLVNALNLGLRADAANKQRPGAVIKKGDELYSEKAPNEIVKVQTADGKLHNVYAKNLNAALDRYKDAKVVG